MDPQRREALSGLALALAAGLCLAWPPEVHPLSGFGAGLLLALGIVVSPHSFPRMPLFVGLALVAFNLVTSAAPGRGVDVAVRLALGVLTFALATRAGEYGTSTS